MTHTNHTLHIPLTHAPYDIHIKNEQLSHIEDILSPLSLGKKIAIITQDTVQTLYAEPLNAALKTSGYDSRIITVPDGETSKSIEHLYAIITTLLQHSFERNDTLIACGGGVVGDLTGFVAATYLRGINFIQVPTTLLAQVDASIGGKTGINHEKGKNLIGAFYQPRAVIIDPSTLSTLPLREFRSGMAEVIKYGIISNPRLFSMLEEKSTQLSTYTFSDNVSIWESIIHASCKDKAEIVTKDERENNLRAILNFGHTIGHGIEAASGYSRYLHGECVAFGMIAATYLSLQLGKCDPTLLTKIRSLILAYGFLDKATRCDTNKIFDALMLDKKIKNGTLRFVLPKTIGTVDIVDDTDMSLIKEAISYVID